ncbi:hypothetical protein A9Q84_01560 [Halobacteriovorax marinus]|uniref:HD/PDEase domain-containing protein n=1 Tax=Halobacteriovorax marinus TaxID=97084 RepID=A0A1Y5FC84_9BACT|nr:hypothetical protein A9Q84_01560 [Halobacteriovorax marinus]
MEDLKNWEERFINHLGKLTFSDSSHDLHHFKRVWNLSQKICDESCDKLVLLAASYFHDIVSFPKNHPDRSISSIRAAEKTMEILGEMNFPKDKLPGVFHAIEAHSYSANIETTTMEARVIQDADRMESLGSIGLARTFYVSGLMGSSLFESNDPFAKKRELDDKSFAVDHFYVKLLKLQDLMKTEKGRELAKKRTLVMTDFLDQLKEELFV